MSVSIKHNKDDWFWVTDARERKKIQDRLAQRARRKRLAATKQASPESHKHYRSRSDSSEMKPIAQMGGIESISYSLNSRMGVATFAHVVPAFSPERKMALEVPMSVYEALFKNGAMMGLTCSSVVPSKSSKVSETIPLPLHPTALQLTTIHPRWIDRFPFPQMRNNMISLGAILDEEEFLQDLFSMTSFTLKLGGASWDPNAWMIGKEFSQKWGYLFY